MTKASILLSLLACSSCSAVKLHWMELAKAPNYRQRQIPVSTREEAKKVIGNKVNFLKMLFEQSVDPYFGTPKWSPACLEINKLGEIVEEAHSIQSTSSLLLNTEGDPGFCTHGYPLSYVIFLYCDGMKEVLEIKFDKDLNSGLPKDLCN